MDIICYRWSKSGFKGQYQHHIKESIEFAKQEHESFLEKIPLFLREYVSASLDPRLLDDSFNFHGVFAFIQKPSRDDYDYYLNHLKNKPDFEIDFHTQGFNPDTLVYVDDGFVNRIKNKMTLKEAFNKKHLAVYIPL
jgi:hypothetical protein